MTTPSAMPGAARPYPQTPYVQPYPQTPYVQPPQPAARPCDESFRALDPGGMPRTSVRNQ
jgi:hypothetical protein